MRDFEELFGSCLGVKGDLFEKEEQKGFFSEGIL